MKAQIPQAKRSEIVALIARRDSATAIAQAVGVSTAMVYKIRKDEAGAIKAIQERIQASKAEAANRILEKTNQLLEDRVDQASENDRKRQEYAEQLDNDEIDSKKYNALLRALPTITTTDLVSMSREMFNQTAKAEDTPPSSPQAQKEHLLKMLEQIKEGNEVVLERMVFNPHDISQPTS